MISKKYICINSLEGLFWKVGESYMFTDWEIKAFESNLKKSKFNDWFLDKKQYREYLINKILNE